MDTSERPPYANCKFVENAVSRTSGKDIRGSVDNLTQAFAHAKTCKTCSDALGSFLHDVIGELGVKLPNVNRLDGDRDPEYGAPASALTSNEVGAGTIQWDVKRSDAEYKLIPTVASLSLTVNQLQEKCKLKDSMILAMADEFRHLSRCMNWSGADLMASVAETNTISPKVDFDRRALCNYLNTKQPNSFLPTEEEDMEYKATNPLGLRVVRQVGPDSILVEWDPPPPGKVHTFEIYINGLYFQRIRSISRTKSILHPVDLSSKIYITLNALSFTGEACEKTTIPYP